MAAQNGRVAQARTGRPTRRPSGEPLARTRRLAPTLYVLILIGAFLLLSLNHLLWLAVWLVVANALMIAAIKMTTRKPPDTWTGPRLRRPRD